MWRWMSVVAALVSGLCGSLLTATDETSVIAEQREATPQGSETIGRVQRLEEKSADQAHAMVSVAYHFNNLWFAGQSGN